MSADHSHVNTSNPKRLIIALGLTGTFLVGEVVGGIIYGSLALLSDAAHMFTDVMALVIALLAIKSVPGLRTIGTPSGTDALKSLPLPSIPSCYSALQSMS